MHKESHDSTSTSIFIVNVCKVFLKQKSTPHSIIGSRIITKTEAIVLRADIHLPLHRHTVFSHAAYLSMSCVSFT